MEESTLVVSGDTYMVIEAYEEWTTDELYNRMPTGTSVIHHLPIKETSSRLKKLEEINKMIDRIESDGVESFTSKTTICRNV